MKNQRDLKKESTLPRLDHHFPEVTSSYVIASSMRTGSYLLCDGLFDTGVAGNPVEAFCPKYRALYCERWNLPSNPGFDAYFRAMVKNGTTPNGIFGVKVHRHHLDSLAPEISMGDALDRVLPTLFPKAQYVYLSRRDRRAQAISLYRAEATDEWWRIAGEKNPFAHDVQPPFNAEAILAREEFLGGHAEAWEVFFDNAGIEPCRIEYETLERNYRGEVARVLKFLGQDERLAEDLPEPRFVRQRDETTEKWRRMLEEKVAGQNGVHAVNRR